MDDPVAKIKFFAEFAREVRVLLSDSLGNRFAKKLRYKSEWCMTTLVILVAKSERRVINYFLAVVRWSPAVLWSPTCQNLKMIDGPRCLLKAINVSRFY